MKIFYKIITAIYLYGVFYLTLIDRKPTYRRMMMTPFWEYKNLIFSSNHVYWFQQISCNILMLIPLGFLFPLMFQRFRKPLVTVFTGFSLSVFIEIAQYFTSRGLCEFDDVFNNTIGALIGYVIYRKSLFRL